MISGCFNIYSLLVAMVTLSCSYKISEEENKKRNENTAAAHIEREIDVLIKVNFSKISICKDLICFQYLLHLLGMQLFYCFNFTVHRKLE